MSQDQAVQGLPSYSIMTDKANKTKLENKLAGLEVRKQREFRKLQTLYDLTQEIPTNVTKITAFNVRFEQIEKIAEEYSKIQSEIIDVQLLLDSTVQVDSKALESFDDIYYEVKIFASSIKPAESIVPARNTRPSPRLPKINIPTFDGSYKHWVTFYDTYRCLIHENESLSNVEKFQYLITLVQGPASTVVLSVPITESNYAIVWQALIDKYHNKRVLATKYLDEIFDFRALTSESTSGLNTFLQTFQECVTALRRLNIPDLGDFVLLYIALRNLDRSTHKLFEMQLKQTDIPSYDNLITFIQGHAKVLELSNIDKTSNKSPSVKSTLSNRTTASDNKVIRGRSFVAAVQANSKPCPCCTQQHSIYKCPDFLGLDSNQRRDRVRSLQLCFNCLKTTHMNNQCPSKSSCFTCNARHHTLLHSSSQRQSESKSESPPSAELGTSLTPESTSCHALSSRATATPVLLSTAVVHCQDNFGSYQLIRVLIDSGAQSSFITSDCAKRLGLSLRRSTGCIAGLGQTHVQATQGVTTCIIKPRDSEHPKFTTEAIVLPTITTDMPVVHIPLVHCVQFKHLRLADPQFNVPGPIDFLLGADLFPEVFTGETISGYPSALRSIYGWVITGKVNYLVQSPSTVTTLLSLVDSPLDINMRRFWEVEEPPHINVVNPEDLYCEELFTKYHYRDQNGRYVVPLPLKKEAPKLGDSYPQAFSRFQQLERRLTRQPALQKPYEDFMRNYEELGHMRELPSSTTSQYVIPHHPVLKLSSSTTKLRVVFDASAKASCNRSLNDILLTGPKLQTDITDVILKFRMHAIVFSADICKMYRQILLLPEHRPYQHILWRNSSCPDVTRYELNTVTYGVSSAPWLAIRTLHQLAQDEGLKYPDAAKVLQENIYVDDVLTGAESFEEALSLKRQLITLLKSGGFQLRKWSSNCPEILHDVPLIDREVYLPLHSSDDSVVKILGIHWDAQADAFSYKVTLNNKVNTKRALLSVLARIYDPLGWVTPAVFNAKYLIQTLWSLGLGWDDPIPSAIHDQWLVFATQLDELSKLRIKRCIASSNNAEVNLVGFCDASEKGYSSVVYLHTTDSHSRTNVSLLMGKSKVAPLKTLSIPRLELCGAVLLSKLLQYAMSILDTRINRTYAFTDSATVLAWLRTPPFKLKPFVSNRVVQIIEITEPTMWNYVSTDHNPADCASRGLTPRQLVIHPLWWEGPTWLSYQREQWPIASVPCLQPSDIPEIKTSLNTLVSMSGHPASDILQRFSSLTTLQRVTAWCLRFKTNSMLPEKLRRQGPLTFTELREALHVWIRHVQNIHFYKDIESLTKKNSCSPSLRRLNPFLDSSGLLRVGGRLHNAPLPYSARHPLLLPPKSHLTNLSVDHYHRSYLHIGPRALQSVLQRQFWILAARRVIRSRLSKCLICHKMKASHAQPLMGDLPASRVAQGRPFLTVGVDFAGPFNIKESRRRNAKISKAYMCLFVCMSTKAIHLEVVSDLSTPAFLAALDRFVARRGLCSAIYSDCGTNFVGASRYLMGIFKYLHEQSAQIIDATAAKGIQWHFNPPSAPHFGGLWEAGVRSVKYHLRRVIGDQTLTFEELATLLSKIEAILNSRPLFDLSPDTNEFDTLTPGHFLIGAPLVSLPEENFVDTPMNRLSRWQLLQKASQHFWTKWKADYLHTLQQRLKWSTNTPNLKTNDLVIINDGKSTPLQWKLGRIVEVHPGLDNIVRVATIRTSQGTITRPVVKLCPLPAQE